MKKIYTDGASLSVLASSAPSIHIADARTIRSFFCQITSSKFDHPCDPFEVVTTHGGQTVVRGPLSDDEFAVPILAHERDRATDSAEPHFSSDARRATGMIAAMTYNLYFWKSAADDVPPSAVAEWLADGNTAIVVADPAVRQFHRAAVAAFPDVAQGMLAPELNGPDVDRYAIATMFMGDLSRYGDLVALALSHRLTIYDPQLDELVLEVPPDSTPGQAPSGPFRIVPMPGATSTPCPRCGATVPIQGPIKNFGPMPVVQAGCPTCGSELQVMRPRLKP